jgi:predicted enzyme related to lactoylglutathione lyase
MRDPFTELRAADSPVSPAPAFAAGLRARLERALSLPRGVAPMSGTATTTETADATTTVATARPRGAAVPYLAVADARRALDWYAEVFGATVVGEPIVMPDGRIGHAELALPDGAIYLADEHPELGIVAPDPTAASVSLMLAVADADAVRAQALDAGASGEREPYDGYGERHAWIVDPFGHRWGLHSPLRATGSPACRQGDVVYVSLWVPDEERAAAFYADVLGWDVTDEGGRHRVLGASPNVGMFGRPGPVDLFCCYAVDDVYAAVQRVRDAGGRAGEPNREPHGVVADCVDDQGTEFAVWQIEAGTEQPTKNGRRAGDLSYLTLEVVNSAKARAFYGSVLGWTFSPGRIEDGWAVEDARPMVGFSGGHDRATAVPMWRVDDIATAVAAVRAAGGTATDPQRQPYGITSDCTDDQGSRFYLGQL